MNVSTALTTISNDIYAVKDQFNTVLSDKSINFEREAGFAIQVLSANDYAMSTALNNRQSVVDAVVNIAAIGLSLNPAKKQAYLVPRKPRHDQPAQICLDISYMGLIELALASGSVKWAQAAIVYSGDTFRLMGYDKPPEHVFSPFATDRGSIVGVYVVIKTAFGEYLTHTMAIADVYSIRDRSSAWKAYMDGKTKSGGPWQSDEGEMIKKTCVKQAYKYWPKTERLDTAIHHLNTESGEGLAELAAPEQEPKTLGNRVIAVKQAAMDGIGDDLPVETKQVLEAVATAIIDHFNRDDVMGAYEEYMGINDTGHDERAYVWRKLPSKARTAIKKHGAEVEAKEKQLKEAA